MPSVRDCVIRHRSVLFDSTLATSSIRSLGCSSTARHRPGAGACISASDRRSDMRLARRLLHALVIVLTLIVGATAAAVIVAETAWFKNLLRAFIVRQANLYLNGQLSIGRLGGNLFFGVELENIGV